MAEDRPFAHVPTMNPADWYELRAFRETFLCDISRKEMNDVFRAFGKLQSNLVAEAADFWPFTYMDATAHFLQAVLADLRFLQGFLDHRCDREELCRDGDLDQYDGAEAAVKRHDALCELGNRVAQQLGALAAELEKEVGGWQFKKRPPGT